MESNNTDGTYNKSKVLEHITFRNVAKLSEQTANVIARCSIDQSTNKYFGWHFLPSAHNALQHTEHSQYLLQIIMTVTKHQQNMTSISQRDNQHMCNGD